MNLKNISLITEVEELKDHNFIATSLNDVDLVGFEIRESEFVYNSLNMRAYDANGNELPCKDEKQKDNNFKPIKNNKIFYCPNDFYIVIDKGIYGFDSSIFVTKASITEEDDEFIVNVCYFSDGDIAENVLAKYFSTQYTVPEFCSEYFSHKLNYEETPVATIVTTIEKTAFLNVLDNQYAVPVKLDKDGNYIIDDDNEVCPYDKKFKTDNDNQMLNIGDYLYRTEIFNTVEIVQVTSFAHSVYGSFYAVAQKCYMFPKDTELIKYNLPNFYAKHCIFDNAQRVRNYIGKVEKVAYIPDNTKLGDMVIYEKLQEKKGVLGISSDKFHLLHAKFRGSTLPLDDIHGGAGVYENDVFIRVEKSETLVTLVRTNGSFRLLVYAVAKYVEYNNEYYAQIEFIGSTGVINDLNKYNTYLSYKNRAHFINGSYALRNIQYLLFRNKIKPIDMTEEELNSIIDSDKNAIQ